MTSRSLERWTYLKFSLSRRLMRTLKPVAISTIEIKIKILNVNVEVTACGLFKDCTDHA